MNQHSNSWYIADALFQQLGIADHNSARDSLDIPPNGTRKHETLIFTDHKHTELITSREETRSFPITAVFGRDPPKGEVLCHTTGGEPAITLEDNTLRFAFDPFEFYSSSLAEDYGGYSNSWLRRLALKIYWAAPRSARSLLRNRLRRQVASRVESVDELRLYGVSGNVIVKLIENHLISLGIGKHKDTESFAAITHDIDSDFCQTEGMEAVSSVEADLGIKATWFFVPKSVRYKLNRLSVKRLLGEGQEIGLHGLTHDGNLKLNDSDILAKQINKGRELMEPLGAKITSFRSPFMLRSPLLLRVLANAGFIVDSSYPDVDTLQTTGGLTGISYNRPFRPLDWSAKGTPKMLPLWEIPSTSPQDVQLIEDLKLEPEVVISTWQRKAEFCRDFGGVFVLHTHPWHIANDPEAYIGFLKKLGFKTHTLREIAMEYEKRAAWKDDTYEIHACDEEGET